MAGLDLADRPNFYFEANNRNKKSLTLDLKQPEARRDRLRAGREVRRLRPELPQGRRRAPRPRLRDAARAQREAHLRQRHGLRARGPESGEPSFDQLGLARSGIMLAAGEPDMPPLAIAGGIADQMGAIMLAYGVLAAVVARERFGSARRSTPPTSAAWRCSRACRSRRVS